jgi:hypothetical protein
MFVMFARCYDIYYNLLISLPPSCPSFCFNCVCLARNSSLRVINALNAMLSSTHLRSAICKYVQSWRYEAGNKPLYEQTSMQIMIRECALQ